MKINFLTALLIAVAPIIPRYAAAQLANVPCTGYNNDIVAGGVGVNAVVGITNPTIGTDGARYTFIDNTFQYVSTNALPTCYMPVNGLAPSMQTAGLTYQFQPYGAGTTLSNNALTIVNQSTGYTSPYPSSGSLSLITPASFSKLYVLYETVSNVPTTGFTFDATVTFTDATTQSFPANACVNWFTATLPAFNNVGRTSPGGAIECGTQPNFFELQMPLLPANYTKLVQSITFSIPTILTGTFPYSVNYFHAMAVGGLTPCNAPTAQPTIPQLSTFSTSQINGTFTAAAGSPTGYLVVRYPAGATEVVPVSGTTYTVGQSLGTGTVVQSSASTSFSATGLSGSTTYDFYVYSYNGNSTCGGPMYYTTGGFIGTQATNACGTMSGIIPVGASAPASPNGFTSLTAALTYINANGLGGATTLELQTDYDVAQETFPIVFSLNPCVSAANPLTVRPAAAVASPFILSSGSTTATIVFDGASNITIDGRNGGTGTNKFISIVNTSSTVAASGNAILLINDANTILLTYLDVQAANVNAAANSAIVTAGAIPGAIAIGSTTGINGNDNNTISYCDIHSTGANLNVGIYAGSNSTAGLPANNDNNIINGNNIFDFYNAATASAGLDIAAGNNTYTVTNNKVYQSVSRTYTGTQGVRGFWITPNIASLTSASGYTISHNYIGGNSSAGTGTYTITGTAAYSFYAMDLSLGIGTASSVQDNTITNLNITGGFTGNNVYGINVSNGNVNVGTVTGNVIGSATVNGAITFNTTVTNGSMIGLRSGGGAAINFSNNIISGIDLNGNATTVAPGFNGIAGSGGTTITVSNNIIGSTSLANSINIVSTSATSTTATAVRGIICNSAGTGVINTITNNTVCNLNTNYSATGAQSNTLVGIAVTTGTSTITGNTIKNLTSASQTTAGVANAAIVGIPYTSTTAGVIISNNTIHSLKLTNSSSLAAIKVAGMVYFGPSSGTNIFEKNKISNLSVASSSNSAGTITGMDLGSGLITVMNNMISLGYDETGASVTAPLIVRGITNNAGTSNVWFNSIYIGGTGVGVSAINTFCYAKTGTPITDVRNNIFVNERSNATSGASHYSVYLNNSTSLTLNYNDYYGTGNGYVFAYTGTANVAAYAAGWIASDMNSITGNPQYLNPTGTPATVDLHVNSFLSTPIDQAGTVAGITNAPADDIDGDVRANFTPVDIGADALNVLGVNSNSPVCEGSPLNLVAVPSGAASYAWSGPNGFTSTTQNPSFANSTLAEAGTYTCVITVGTVATTATTTVVVNPLPVVTITSFSSTVCSGVPTNLNQTGLTNYTWSTGDISMTPITVIPTSTQMYTVSGTDANGCAGLALYTLNVIPSPTVSVSASNNFICSGTSATLTQTGLTTFSWSPSGGTVSPTSVSPTITTTFTVSGTSANGCAGSATKLITVVPAPIISLVATDTLLCAGAATTITQTGLQNFIWTPGGSSVNPLTVTPTATTLYTINGIDGNGCGGSATINITVNPFATVYISASDSSLCDGSSVTLSQSGLSTFAWSAGLGTTSPVTDTPLSTQLYSVSGTDANGCAGSASLTVTVNAMPVVMANATAATICEGTAETLSGSGAATYVWDNGVTDAVPFNPTATATYNVTGTDINGCTGTASTTITVNPAPVISIDLSAVDTLCIGLVVNLTGETPTGGVYSGIGVVGNTFNTDTSGAGTFAVTYTYTDANTCSAAASANIYVDLCTGINQTETAADAMTIYPNPFSAATTIRFSELQNNTELKVFDVLGKVVKEENLNGIKEYFLEKNNLKSGVYFVKVSAKKGTVITQKLVVE